MSRWMTLAAAAPLGLFTMTGATSPPGDSSGAPDGSGVAVDAGPIGEPSPLEVDGFLDSISSDGRWVAGTGDGRVPCIWDVESLTATCADEVVGLRGNPSRPSMVWSPDAQRVAFTPDVFTEARDGDIFVMDLEGTLANLTDDGYDGGLIGGDAPDDLAVDTLPTWSPDGDRIAFVREDATGAPASIMEIDSDGGDPVEIGRAPIASRFSVWPTMTWVADDSVLLTTNPADLDDPGHGIWNLDPETGESAEIVTEPGRVFELTSVSPDGTTARVADAAMLSNLAYVASDPAMTSVVTELDLVTGESTPVPWLDVEVGALVPPPVEVDEVLSTGLAVPGGTQAYSPDGTMWAGKYRQLDQAAEYLVVGDVGSGELVGALDLSSRELAGGISTVHWVDGGVFARSAAGTAVWVPISTD